MSDPTDKPEQMHLFLDYLKKVERDLQSGSATEHTYRPYLKDLLEDLKPAIRATNEPKRVECGAPDYVVTKGETPLGLPSQAVARRLQECR